MNKFLLLIIVFFNLGFKSIDGINANLEKDYLLICTCTRSCKNCYPQLINYLNKKATSSLPYYIVLNANDDYFSRKFVMEMFKTQNNITNKNIRYLFSEKSLSDGIAICPYLIVSKNNKVDTIKYNLIFRTESIDTNYINSIIIK